jgi:Lar family restriction alleviation protein
MSEPQTTNLKTCPFCGGDPAVVYAGPGLRQIEHARAWGEDYDVSYYVQCCGCAATSHEAADRSDAIAAWNRRAS